MDDNVVQVGQNAQGMEQKVHVQNVAGAFVRFIRGMTRNSTDTDP